MFVKSGKKEIWLGTSVDTYLGGEPELEISWGLDGKNRVIVPFEIFIDDELGQNEQGGSNSGGKYDEGVLQTFRRMRKTLKQAMKHVRRRNGI